MLPESFLSELQHKYNHVKLEHTRLQNLQRRQHVTAAYTQEPQVNKAARDYLDQAKQSSRYNRTSFQMDIAATPTEDVSTVALWLDRFGKQPTVEGATSNSAHELDPNLTPGVQAAIVDGTREDGVISQANRRRLTVLAVVLIGIFVADAFYSAMVGNPMSSPQSMLLLPEVSQYHGNGERIYHIYRSSIRPLVDVGVAAMTAASIVGNMHDLLRYRCWRLWRTYRTRALQGTWYRSTLYEIAAVPIFRALRPKVQPDRERMEWKCSCGRLMYGDYSKHDTMLSPNLVKALPRCTFSPHKLQPVRDLADCCGLVLVNIWDYKDWPIIARWAQSRLSLELFLGTWT